MRENTDINLTKGIRTCYRIRRRTHFLCYTAAFRPSWIKQLQTSHVLHIQEMRKHAPNCAWILNQLWC